MPNVILRMGARRQTAKRLAEISTPNVQARLARTMAFVDNVKKMDIAIKEEAANQQHYEVSPGVLSAALGPRMKYSACLFKTGKETIAEAEDAMLESYIEKGDFQDGMRILDLG